MGLGSDRLLSNFLRGRQRLSRGALSRPSRSAGTARGLQRAMGIPSDEQEVDRPAQLARLARKETRFSLRLLDLVHASRNRTQLSLRNFGSSSLKEQRV